MRAKFADQLFLVEFRASQVDVKSNRVTLVFSINELSFSNEHLACAHAVIFEERHTGGLYDLVSVTGKDSVEKFRFGLVVDFNLIVDADTGSLAETLNPVHNFAAHAHLL